LLTPSTVDFHRIPKYSVAVPHADPLAQPAALVERVYAYVAYRIGSGPDAEDVTSETFARALRYRSTFDPRKGNPLGWLIGISRRCIAEHLGTPDAGSELAGHEAPGDLEEQVIRRVTVAAALESLAPRDRELVALRYGADLTAREIGRLLDLKTNAVEVALHRAVARLAGVLEPSEGQTKPSAAVTALRSDV
jgi:RNA polymerase sigma factor (sigma-70 family)